MAKHEHERFKLLIDGLILFGMDKEETRFIAEMLYNKPEKIEILMEWMADHPKATPDDISNQVLQIIKQK